MHHRPLISLLLLAFHTAHAGQSERMRLGEEALDNSLWEIAALHFNECLGDPDLDAAGRSEVAIRLAEAWLRDGKAAQALELLGKSFVDSHPEAAFWKGQSLAALGRINEALETLVPLLQDDATKPWRTEIALTIRNLQLALGKPQEALETLKSLKVAAPGPASYVLTLAQAETLLELGLSAEASQSLSELGELSPSEKTRAMFIEGRIFLSEKKSTEAAEVFRILLDQPQSLSPQMHLQAAIGLSDALVASGNREAAISHLLEFIRNHPDLSHPGKLFECLREAMPDSMSATDPILEILTEWIASNPLPATGLLSDYDAGAASASPGFTTPDERNAQALYTKAFALRRISSPDATDEARRLLTRLRLEYAGHPLADRALFDLARIAHEAGRHQAASDLLTALRESATDPSMRGQAAFTEAMNAYRDGDAAAAALLFEEAGKSLDQHDAQTARFNAAILHLIQNEGKTPAADAGVVDSALAADLELEQALSQAKPADRRAAIEEFLLKHPSHPRVGEARLAAAEAALADVTPDLSFARAQLDTLIADPEKFSSLNSARVSYVRLRIMDMAGDSAAAMSVARDILERYPEDSMAAEASLTLGRHLFQTGSYNEARMVLEKLAANDGDKARAEAAWLLAARSASLIPASQSQQEALVLFDKVIEANGSLAALARLEKSRLMIDMNRLDEAAGGLRVWFEKLDFSDPMRLPAGLLLAEAIYGQGGMHAESLTEALELYDGLLSGLTSDHAMFNRIQYLRGRTLEQIPDSEDPTRKREKEAFAAYYSVLEVDSTPAEWHYFELSGFRALALLEKAGRWPAAVACARKIASFKGPRAEEAEARSSQLQLKHTIWED